MKIGLGNLVEVVTSHYSGINPGDRGVVKYKKDKGFGVEFIKTWPQNVSHEKAITNSRIVYFEPHQLKVIEQ